MKIKQTARSTKQFVSRHRVAIAVGATATVAIALQMRNAAQLNEFLKEHNLFDLYYAMDEI